MKKKNLYIIIGLAAAGGFYYYMKKNQKKKEEEKKQIEEVVKSSPLKKIVQAVKKIKKPVIKKETVNTAENNMPFTPSSFIEKISKGYKPKPVKKEKYNFPFIKPRTVGNFPNTF
jgi:molybdopterin-guanine dinucleotide biosynthesis protein A